MIGPRQRYFLKKGIIFSFALHALVILCLFIFRNKSNIPLVAKSEKKKIYVEIDSFSRKQKQIVQSDLGEITEQRVKDAYLGEKNQKVKQETIRIAETNSLLTASKKTSKSQHSEKNQNNLKSQKNKIQGKSKALTKQLDLKQLGIPIYNNFKKEENLPEWSSAGAGAVGTKEYIKGLKESDRTALNTQEFVFYSYFHRIRQKLDLAWGPLLRTKLEKYYRSGRTILSEREYETKVMIYLNHTGSVTRVQLLKGSGTQDLDESAVEVFNSAGPFPNPPKAMIDENREIKLLWNFVLKT